MADAEAGMRPVDFDPFEPASAREVRLTLTEPQDEMWTAAAMSREANCSYNQCFAFTFHGPLARRVACARRSTRSSRGMTRLRAVIAPDGASQTIRPRLSGRAAAGRSVVARSRGATA